MTGGRHSPVLPIVIKCTSTAEANAAFGLDRLLYRLGYDKAEKDPQTFAKEITASTQISDIFATAGPFYAVYQGKTQRAIYVRN